jgi:hypothetical protein
MNTYVNLPSAPGYTPQQSRAAFNQQMAQAHAESDPRYNTKPLDRAGMSRGGAQQNMAGIASAQNLASGIARAYNQQIEDAQTNTGLQSAAAQESFGLGLSQLQSQQQYADALAALQRQQTLGGGILGGLLGGQGLTNFLGY